jgi:hypothetical protein
MDLMIKRFFVSCIRFSLFSLLGERVVRRGLRSGRRRRVLVSEISMQIFFGKDAIVICISTASATTTPFSYYI